MELLELDEDVDEAVPEPADVVAVRDDADDAFVCDEITVATATNSVTARIAAHLRMARTRRRRAWSWTLPGSGRAFEVAGVMATASAPCVRAS